MNLIRLIDNGSFWSKSDDEKKKLLEIIIDLIRTEFNGYRQEIERQYIQNGVQSFFNKNFFRILKLYLLKV